MSVLVAKRNELTAKSNELLALSTKADLTTDEICKVKELAGIVTTLKGEVETLAGAETLNAELKAATGVTAELEESTKKETALATNKGIEFDGFAYNEKQAKAIQDPTYAKTVRKWIAVKGDMDRLDSMERKALNEGIDPEGGYLAPVQMVNRLISRKPAPTRLSGLATRINCSGKSLAVPFVNYTGSDNSIYTSGVRATLVGERPAATDAAVTDQSFGQKKIEIDTWMLTQRLTNDMVEDANIDLIGFASDKFSETVELLFENQMLNGLGDGRGFMGIITNAEGTEGVAATDSTVDNSFAAVDLIGLPFDVAEQYIANGKFVMNRASSGKTVAQMLDGSNRPLWQRGGMWPGITDPTPDLINGYPVIYSAFMPDKANAAYPVLFGDFSAYWIAMRASLSLQILRETAAKENAVELVGRLRAGGDLIEPWAMRALQCI